METIAYKTAYYAKMDDVGKLCDKIVESVDQCIDGLKNR